MQEVAQLISEAREWRTAEEGRFVASVILKGTKEGDPRRSGLLEELKNKEMSHSPPAPAPVVPSYTTKSSQLLESSTLSPGNLYLCQLSSIILLF